MHMGYLSKERIEVGEPSLTKHMWVPADIECYKTTPNYCGSNLQQPPATEVATLLASTYCPASNYFLSSFLNQLHGDRVRLNCFRLNLTAKVSAWEITALTLKSLRKDPCHVPQSFILFSLPASMGLMDKKPSETTPYHLAGMWHRAGHATVLQRAGETSPIGRAHFSRRLHGVSTRILRRGWGEGGGRGGGGRSRSPGSSSIWWRFPSIFQALLPLAWSLWVSWPSPNIATTGAASPPAPLLPPPVFSDPELLIRVSIFPREVLHHCSVETPLQIVSHLGIFYHEKRNNSAMSGTETSREEQLSNVRLSLFPQPNYLHKVSRRKTSVSI